MGKYGTYSTSPESKSKKKKVHPIWRGVGFGLAILTPILAYFGSAVIIREPWFMDIIPRELLMRGSDPLWLVRLLTFLILVFVIFTVFQAITFLAYRLFGPPRYGPYDVPPASYRGKRTAR
ncbi:MAG TPA: hypothetical protein PLV53_05360 [Anaerolineaceae bacterium]|nr:hypothetical protein [Anaerolineaceae bacterium]